MGYNLYITRAVPAYYSTRFPITGAEVRAVVRSAADLDIPESTSDEHILVTVGADDWLMFDDGHLHTKSPGDPLVRRMIEIAVELDAHVAGEADEVYDWDGTGITSVERAPRPSARITSVTTDDWVAAQPDFTWLTELAVDLPSGRRMLPCPPVACWTGHPSGEPVPFFMDDYSDGVQVVAPDAATLDRLRRLGGFLRAGIDED
ncbi:hypothetical protein [Actinoplanes sp. G11-F43]|uniref:hypothetical protein n=1 Tax=Actinoplanes sp. G11-F43 TaxID=3424130 RepID=UPI003D32FF65